MASSSGLSFSLATILEKAFGAHRPHLAIDDWRVGHERLLAELRKLLAPFPIEAAPLNQEIVSTQRYQAVTHHKITSSSREGVLIPAHLLIPKGITERTPAVLCIHGMCGTERTLSFFVQGSMVFHTLACSLNKVLSLCLLITRAWVNGHTQTVGAISCGVV